MLLALSIVSGLLIFSVVASLIRNDFWVFRVLEYPRLQKLFVLLAVAGLWMVYWPVEAWYHHLMLGGVILCLIYLFYKVLPYTVLAKKEMQRVPAGDGSNELRIFAANVLQENTAYGKMLEQIKACNPDIVFLLETNQAWADGVASLATSYPHQLLASIENTYGLLFYSRLPLENAAVKFLVKDDIPSIETLVTLPSGQQIQIWGVHPEPPVPGENLYATAKDKELMKVALKAKTCKLPCMVFGDLNDVAWSHTTELFRKTSRLLDPRRGRGFYSTFSAHHWYLRFPLDYIFCSTHFGLIQMKRMPKNGSDHFATFTHLQFRADMEQKQEAPKADKTELEEARDMATQPVKE